MSGCTHSVYVETDYNSNYYEAESFARAFGVDQLHSTGKNELRVWSQEYVFGDIQGNLLKGGGAMECNTTVKQDSELVYSIKPGRCRRSEHFVDDEELSEMLALLIKFNGTKVTCTNVMDGWGGIVEGVYMGKRFAFFVMNPEHCSDPGAQEVTKVLNRLGG